jgi:hypothetical protein
MGERNTPIPPPSPPFPPRPPPLYRLKEHHNLPNLANASLILDVVTDSGVAMGGIMMR